MVHQKLDQFYYIGLIFFSACSFNNNIKFRSRKAENQKAAYQKGRIPKRPYQKGLKAYQKGQKMNQKGLKAIIVIIGFKFCLQTNTHKSKWNKS